MRISVNKQILETIPCISFPSRLIGLMFQRNIKIGRFFPNCNSIHTFFMREPIDILFVDLKNQVIGGFLALKPWRVSSLKKGYAVYEFPQNTFDHIPLGDMIEVIKPTEKKQ